MQGVVPRELQLPFRRDVAEDLEKLGHGGWARRFLSFQLLLHGDWRRAWCAFWRRLPLELGASRYLRYQQRIDWTRGAQERRYLEGFRTADNDSR